MLTINPQNQCEEFAVPSRNLPQSQALLLLASKVVEFLTAYVGLLQANFSKASSDQYAICREEVRLAMSILFNDESGYSLARSNLGDAFTEAGQIVNAQACYSGLDADYLVG